MRLSEVLKYCIAAVWFANGLICKVLDLVPRHREIVARILGEEHSLPLTRAIGVAEIAMGVWVLSRIFRRINAVAQIAIVMTMNVIEFLVVPDMLLFGRLNILVAVLFCSVVYYREFLSGGDAQLS